MSSKKRARGWLIAILILTVFFVPSGAKIRKIEKVDYGASSRTPEPTAVPTPTPEPTPTPKPTAIPTPGTYEMLRKKDAGTRPDEVKRMQERLRELGYLNAEPDGFFGSDTFNALVAFQRNNGLEGDGIAGQETQRILYESEKVIDVTGRIFAGVESLIVTPKPTPTPTPAPVTLERSEFTYGSRPVSVNFASGNYQDDTISVRTDAQPLNGATVFTAEIHVSDPLQIRSALAGTLETPASDTLLNLASYYRAVVAVAGDSYADFPDGYEVRQAREISAGNGGGDLLVIDDAGAFRIFTSVAREKGIRAFDGTVLHAFSGGTALLINGIAQGDLDAETTMKMTAVGQNADGTYMIACVYAGGSREGATQTEFAAYLLKCGCRQAYLLATGEASGVYFGGSLIGTGDAWISDMLYFASAQNEGGDPQ